MNAICVFCGKELKKEECNNPYPIIADDESSCCSTCNEAYVMPARNIELEERTGTPNGKTIVKTVSYKFL